MKVWNIVLLCLAVAGLLWWLSPSRTLTPNEPGVVEISFTGTAGFDTPAMDDAFRAFEDESAALHQKNPSRPIYRVINGQSAA